MKNNDLGLLYGTTGNAVCQFLQHQLTGNPLYAEKGNTLLQTVLDRVDEIGTITMKNGLQGVGWAIEYLSHLELIHINTDEILEDLDDYSYQFLISCAKDDISLETGLLGQALYSYMRHLSNNADASRYRSMYHLISLVYIIDALHDHLSPKDNSTLHIKITTIADWLLFLADFLALNINETVTEQVLFRLSNAAKEQLLTADKEHDPNRRLYLAVAWYVAGLKYGSRHWQKAAQQHIDALLPVIEINITSEDQQSSLLKAVLLLRNYSDNDLHKAHCKEVITLLKGKDLPSTIKNGMAGPLLYDLSRKNHTMASSAANLILLL